MEHITNIEADEERAEFVAVLRMAAGFWIAAYLLRFVHQFVHLSLNTMPVEARFWQFLRALDAPAIAASITLVPLWMDASFAMRGFLILSGLAAVSYTLACLVFTSTPRTYASRIKWWLAAIAVFTFCSGLILGFIPIWPSSRFSIIADLVFVPDSILAVLLCIHLRKSFRHVHDRPLQKAIDPVMWLAVGQLITHLTTLMQLDESAASRIFPAFHAAGALTGLGLFALMVRVVWVTAPYRLASSA